MSNGDLGAIFGSAFDTSQYEGLPDYELIKPGKYQVVIDKAELRDTKKGDGRYIWLEMSIVNHESLNNRKVWANINIHNPNPVCVEMGTRVLAALGKAAGINKIEDTSQLVGANVIAHVKVKDEQNNVRTFSVVPVAQAPGHAPAPPSTGAAPHGLPAQTYQQPAQVWQPQQQQPPSPVPPPQAPPPPSPPMQPVQYVPKNQLPQQGLPWAR